MQQAITCKNCGHQFNGRYCNYCGEKVYHEKDKSVFHFFEEGLHFITHFEGKFFTTVKSIFTRPGLLSLDYCNGKRKIYFKPLSLFLLLVFFYLLLGGAGALNMHLYYHTHNSMYGDFAMQQVTHRMQQKNINGQQLEELFHPKSEKTSKFLLLILLPLTALFFWLLTFKKRKYFFDQMVFAAEVNCIYLLIGFLITPVLLLLFAAIYHAITGAQPPFEDNVLAIIVYIIIGIYVYAGSKRFYHLTWWQSLSFSILFILAHIFIILPVYKFLLFIITINQIH